MIDDDQNKTITDQRLQEIMTLAEQSADNRIVSVLEGGYALNALGRSVAAHIKTLMRL